MGDAGGLGDEDLAELVHQYRRQKPMPEAASRLFDEGCEAGSALLLCYADNGLFWESRKLWLDMVNSSFVPDVETVIHLIEAYGRTGQFEEITRVTREVMAREYEFVAEVYSSAICCFGKAGQLEMMEATLKEMGSNGMKVDSMTGNAFLKYYSMFGSLAETEAAYGRLKRTRILIEKHAIRWMIRAYVKRRKFYKLGEFLRDVGLRRRNVGNLLWNSLLLSYAGNFKMKSLQREFLRMVEGGFSPDLTTFNVRALAFSRMCMFWDLHLSLEHMNREKVAPDLVTCGCLVDMYVERRLGRDVLPALEAAAGPEVMKSRPRVLTDPLVFEVFGKGDFHAFSEALLDRSGDDTRWTYSRLISMYLKRRYRSNQIFWNY